MNEFHIPPNFMKIKKNKMSVNLNNLENLEEKRDKIQPCAQPPKNWPGALINKYTKLGKTGAKVLLILRLAHINLPL